jgi:hypothetical protein
MKILKNMRTIEKSIVLGIIINLIIWGNQYWKKLDLFYCVLGILSILTSYFVILIFLKGCMDSFAEKILQKAVEFFAENYNTKKIEFYKPFYQDRSREYTSYIYIALIILDGFSLYKFKFSVLSIVNTLINSGNYSE